MKTNLNLSLNNEGVLLRKYPKQPTKPYDAPHNLNLYGKGGRWTW